MIPLQEVTREYQFDYDTRWAQTIGSTGKGQKGSEVTWKREAFSVTEKGYLENPCYKRDF